MPFSISQLNCCQVQSQAFFAGASNRVVISVPQSKYEKVSCFMRKQFWNPQDVKKFFLNHIIPSTIAHIFLSQIFLLPGLFCSKQYRWPFLASLSLKWFTFLVVKGYVTVSTPLLFICLSYIWFQTKLTLFCVSLRWQISKSI